MPAAHRSPSAPAPSPWFSGFHSFSPWASSFLPTASTPPSARSTTPRPHSNFPRLSASRITSPPPRVIPQKNRTQGKKMPRPRRHPSGCMANIPSPHSTTPRPHWPSPTEPSGPPSPCLGPRTSAAWFSSSAPYPRRGKPTPPSTPP